MLSTLAGWTAYLVVAYIWWVQIYKFLYRTHRKEFSNLDWDTSDRVFGILWGGFVAFFWPISVPVAILLWVATKIAKSGILSRIEGPLSRLEK